MKKLAIITTHPIQYQVPLFKNLNKIGVNFKVFFASKHGHSLNKIDPEFLQKIQWDISSNILKGYKNKFSKIQKYNINDFRLNYHKIEHEFKQQNFDYILILGWNNLHYLRAIYFAIKNNINIILRVETNLESTKNFFKKYIKRIILKFFFKKISYFLSIGKLNKKFYLYHGVKNKKIFPAPYFVDNKFFLFKDEKKILKKKLYFANKKIVLFVGKLIKRKNPFEFLELSRLYKKNLDIHFIMIGDGFLKNECSDFVKSNNLQNVSIIGFVNQKELREYYNISHLMILPSLYETWGLTVNEAFASNIPVICTDNCGCSSDLIENGKTGFTYKSGDLESLYKKTKLILNDKKLSGLMKKNIKKKIKKYSLEYTSNSICKILNDK